MPTPKNIQATTEAPEPREEVKIGPQELLEAAFYRAWVTVREEDKLTKGTIDAVVQLLKFHREYSPQEDVPTKYRVEWLTESEYASLRD